MQRALNLSSPSVAQYNLTKLERVGLVKKEMGDYVVNRVLLNSCVKVNRFLVPRYLFYSVLASAILTIQILLLKPDVPYREYYFSIMATLIFLGVFCYETIRVWLKGIL